LALDIRSVRLTSLRVVDVCQQRIARAGDGTGVHHWQASQSGLSIAQNLAVGRSRLRPPPRRCTVGRATGRAVGRHRVELARSSTVDFSACVAPMVRR
jgi:hypothetical protein